MARYIDADALLSKLPDDLPYKASVKRVLIQAQEADVVPKSEVDYWKTQCFHACMNNGCLDTNSITRLFENSEGHKDQRGEDGVEGQDGVGGLQWAISYAKSEVAREIFEEIEFDIHQLMFEREETRAIAIEGIIAELKKKYTEDQSGG